MKIAILLTGNELMSGDTLDSNSCYLAQSLKEHGMVPYIKSTVGDDEALLVQAMTQLSETSDVLVVNGGLGPTVDDLTAQTLATAAGSPLREHPKAMQVLKAWADTRNFKLTESNLKQALLPEVCDIIENHHGSAPGFYCQLNGCLVICTPGVPSEFKPMVDDDVVPMICQLGGIATRSKVTRLRTFGYTESGFQDEINRLLPDWPTQVDLGFRVQTPILEVKITTVGEQLDVLNDEWTNRLLAHFGEYTIGRDSTSLPQAVVQLLASNGKKVTTAESCTGGQVASLLTSQPGSSAVFEAGFVTYSNDMKQAMIGVNQATLTQHGAVSEPVVIEMAHGALTQSNADIAVAISGIAGPDGGSEEKPVGTVCMAIVGKHVEFSRTFSLMGLSRAWIQSTSAAIALDQIRRSLLNLPMDVDYFSELKR